MVNNEGAVFSTATVKDIVSIIKQAEESGILELALSEDSIANMEIAIPSGLPSAISTLISAKKLDPAEAFPRCGCPGPDENPMWPFEPRSVQPSQFNPCFGVEVAVVDLQRRVTALEEKVG